MVGGGFSAVMWGEFLPDLSEIQILTAPTVFIRSLSLHLQICWQLVPGRKFLIGAQLAGWGIPALSLALTLVFAGVSYRFVTTCHINHKDSIPFFWAPLLTFAAGAALLQFTTFGYCVRVYIRSLLDDNDPSTNSSALPSFHGSIRTVTARAAYRRISKVIHLQWRGIMVVINVIVTVTFFSIVFIQMDNTVTSSLAQTQQAKPWLICLITNPNDKDKCLPIVGQLVMSDSIVMAVLIVFSVRCQSAIITTRACTNSKVVAQRILVSTMSREMVYGLWLD